MHEPLKMAKMFPEFLVYNSRVAKYFEKEVIFDTMSRMDDP